MNLRIIFLIATSFLFINCNNDDINTDEVNIMGKWQIVEKYENNEQTLSTFSCEKHNYIEINADNTLKSEAIICGAACDFVYCPLFSFSSEWQWEYLGNNRYRIYANDQEDKTYVFYLENDNLIQENLERDVKYVHEKYNE